MPVTPVLRAKKQPVWPSWFFAVASVGLLVWFLSRTDVLDAYAARYVPPAPPAPRSSTSEPTCTEEIHPITPGASCRVGRVDIEGDYYVCRCP